MAKELMTAFMCETDLVTSYRYVYADYTPQAAQEYKPIDVVIAPTRDKAKRLFYNKYSWDIEFTDIRTTKLSEGEEGPARIVGYRDPRYDDLWALYEVQTNPSEALSWLTAERDVLAERLADLLRNGTTKEDMLDWAYETVATQTAIAEGAAG